MSNKEEKETKTDLNEMSTLHTEIEKSTNEDVKNEDVATENLDNFRTLGSAVEGTGELTGLVEGREHEVVEGENDKNNDNVSGINSSKSIKTNEISTQAGVNPQTEIVKYYEETFAPESCEIHSSELIEMNKDRASNSCNREEVEVQVGVSFIDEPEKIISSAKKERILQIVDDYSKFVDRERELISIHKTIYDNIFDEIENKKMQHYAWHARLKEYFVSYGNFCKEFYEKCQKVHKESEVQEHNKYLNISYELQDGFDNLAVFKKETGDKYIKMSEFVFNKYVKELDEVYNKYVLDLCVSQGKMNEKKAKFIKNEDEYKKQAGKVIRMFGRAKESKMKEGDDFFVEICKFLGAERVLHESMLEWGEEIVSLKKSLVDLTENCVVDIQLILNSFKNESNNLYGIHNQKFQKMIKSRSEIEEDCVFANLINLENKDHIKYILEAQIHKEVIQITDELFVKFIGLSHLQKNIKECHHLLPNLIVKKFDTKEINTELVSTISNKFVFYNKETFEIKEEIFIKNIVSILPIADGVLELEEKVMGIIFKSKKSVKIEFQNSDRAEELICFFGEGVQEQ